MRFNIGICLIILGFILLSNQWFSWDAGVSHVGAQDVVDSYEPILNAAPDFPKQKLYSHHAQRFVVYTLVGALAKLTNTAYQTWMNFCLAICIALLILALYQIFTFLKIAAVPAIFAAAFYFTCPSTIRYYLLVPGMVTDLFFVLGTAWICLGLFARRNRWLFWGLFLTIITKQTALTLLPFLFLWVYAIDKKRKDRLLVVATSALILVGTYVFLGITAKEFSRPQGASPLLLLLENIEWFARGGSLVGFLEHITRILMPFVPALSAFLALALSHKKISRESLALLFMAACIISQPFLFGPTLTGNSGSRLGAMGLFPVALALALEWKPTESTNEWKWSQENILLLALLAVGSLHHLYSRWFDFGVTAFFLKQILVSLGIFLLFIRRGAKLAGNS